jgi:hypothetical protein
MRRRGDPGSSSEDDDVELRPPEPASEFARRRQHADPVIGLPDATAALMEASIMAQRFPPWMLTGLRAPSRTILLHGRE